MLPARKNIRLDNYDYSRNGAYFITLCTKDKMCICWDNNDKYQPLPQENTPQTVGAACPVKPVSRSGRNHFMTG